MNWVTSVIWATVFICPIFLLAGVALRNFGIQSDVTATLWVGGNTIGLIFWLAVNGRAAELVEISGMWVTIFAFSIVFGGAANVLLFHALVSAPNPGLAVGVFNSSGLLVFLSAPILAFLAPQFFPSWEFSLQQGGGIALVIVGLGLITIK